MDELLKTLTAGEYGAVGLLAAVALYAAWRCFKRGEMREDAMRDALIEVAGVMAAWKERLNGD